MGEYQMMQIDENGLLIVLFYQEILDFEDYMFFYIFEVMRKCDVGEVLGLQWIGEDLFEFFGMDEQGCVVSLVDLCGKVVVVNYWFIVCKFCVCEMLVFLSVQKCYVECDDVVFVVIIFDGVEEVVDFFVDCEFIYC